MEEEFRIEDVLSFESSLFVCNSKSEENLEQSYSASFGIMTLLGVATKLACILVKHVYLYTGV